MVEEERTTTVQGTVVLELYVGKGRRLLIAGALCDLRERNGTSCAFLGVIALKDSVSHLQMITVVQASSSRSKAEHFRIPDLEIIEARGHSAW